MTTSGPSEPESPSDLDRSQVELMIRSEIGKLNNGLGRREALIGTVCALIGATTTPVVQWIVDSITRDEEKHSFKLEISTTSPINSQRHAYFHRRWIHPTAGPASGTLVTNGLSQNHSVIYLLNDGDFTETNLDFRIGVYFPIEESLADKYPSQKSLEETFAAWIESPLEPIVEESEVSTTVEDTSHPLEVTFRIKIASLVPSARLRFNIGSSFPANVIDVEGQSDNALVVRYWLRRTDGEPTLPSDTSHLDQSSNYSMLTTPEQSA